MLKSQQAIVKFVKLDEKAVTPAYAKWGDAGADLSSIEKVTIFPYGRASVRTGIAVHIPEGHYGRVASRSGNSFKRGLECGAGIVDAGYRGEVLVLLYNHSNEPVVILPGERIAQLIVSPFEIALFEEAKVLDQSARGATGFGSSGR